MTDKKSSLPYFVIAFSLILLDQITKLYFKGFYLFGIHYEGWRLGMSEEIIPGILNFTFVENPGMAWGIEFGWGKIFLSLFSVIASILLAVLINRLKKQHVGIISGFTLIFAGATGNMIDRVFYGVFFGESPLFYGKVVDFVQVNIPDFLGSDYFPVFNIADACVTVGVAVLFIFQKHLPEVSWTKKKRNESEDSETQEDNTSFIDSSSSLSFKDSQ